MLQDLIVSVQRTVYTRTPTDIRVYTKRNTRVHRPMYDDFKYIIPRQYTLKEQNEMRVQISFFIL